MKKLIIILFLILITPIFSIAELQSSLKPLLDFKNSSSSDEEKIGEVIVAQTNSRSNSPVNSF